MLIKARSVNTLYLLMFFVISVKIAAAQEKKPQAVQNENALNAKIEIIKFW